MPASILDYQAIEPWRLHQCFWKGSPGLLLETQDEIRV